MIGNDVVDLLDTDAAPTWRTPAFDARVFTGAERARVAASPNCVRERWLIWAAKEAAYKLARKAQPTAAFIPRRFEVMPGGGLEARVLWGDFTFECQWVLDQSFVHALCFQSGTQAPDCVGLLRVGTAGDAGCSPAGLSDAVRRLAKREVARVLGVPEGVLAIRKRDRIPSLFLRGQPLAGDLSLSHHGGMVAFAWSPERLPRVLSHGIRAGSAALGVLAMQENRS